MHLLEKAADWVNDPQFCFHSFNPLTDRYVSDITEQ